MRRAMLLENLQHIHENLCFESRIKPPNPYREMWPIDFTNKKIQACQDCGSKFSLKDGSAELICVNCGRIEILDGKAFAMRKTYNKPITTKNTHLNIDFISFSIVVIIRQNYILHKSRKRAVCLNIYKTDCQSKYVIPS